LSLEYRRRDRAPEARYISGSGVVSLLEMLEFSARDYVELAHQIGLLLASLDKHQANQDSAAEKMLLLIAETSRLGLVVTKEHIDEMMMESLKKHPEALKAYKSGRDWAWSETDGPLEMNDSRLCHHLESIYTTMRAELGAILFRAIPREKTKYCQPEWLVNTPIFVKFPETVDEFQKAGRCFAYGENTACLFHLMRVTDFYLRKVAESLGIVYDARNWNGISKVITKKMEEKYPSKTEDWKDREPFYAEILTDIQAISRGHRNAALHELEKKYDEREAVYMLAVIESFARHVSESLTTAKALQQPMGEQKE
jgi:hypothetical protein